jgi:hypothetical protein
MDLIQETTQTILKRYGSQIETEAQKVRSSYASRKPNNPYLWGIMGAIGGWVMGHTWVWSLGVMIGVLIIIAILRPRVYSNTLLSNQIADEAVMLSAQRLFDNPSFDRFGGISEEEFGTLFDEQADDYTSEYMLKGSYHGLRFRICNVEATYEEEEENDYTDSDGNIQTETTTKTVEIFKGSILRIDVPQYFDRSVLVGPYNTNETMDHPKFNTIYGVRCNDRIYARYLLTQSFMDNLVRLAGGIGSIPEIRFMGKKIYVLLKPLQELETLSFTYPESSIERIVKEVTFTAWMLETIGFHNHHIINNSTDRTDYRKKSKKGDLSNAI